MPVVEAIHCAYAGGNLIAMTKSVERLRPIGQDQILAVAATSMRHTTVVLDADGPPLLATPNRDGRAFGRGDDGRLAPEHDGHLAVGGPQVDTDDLFFTHFSHLCLP